MAIQDIGYKFIVQNVGGEDYYQVIPGANVPPGSKEVTLQEFQQKEQQLKTQDPNRWTPYFQNIRSTYGKAFTGGPSGYAYVDGVLRTTSSIQAQQQEQTDIASGALIQIGTSPTGKPLYAPSGSAATLQQGFQSPAVLRSNNLWEFYQAQGKQLPTISERAPLYAQYGGTGNYTGTTAQNVFLLDKLKQGLPKAQAPASASGITTTFDTQLPTTSTTTGDISQATGAAAGLGAFTDLNLKQLTDTLTQFETQKQGLLSQFMGANQGLQDRTQIRNQLNEQYGIKSKLAEIDTLSTEYNQKKAGMETEINNSSNRLATTGFISKEQNAIERKYAPTLNRISADINSKTAILTKNQDLINQAVQDATADQKFKWDQAKMFLDLNIDTIDRMETIYKDAYKEYVRKQEKEYTRLYDEKKDIAKLMMDNPQAGVTTNDNFFQAAFKIQQTGGSLAAQREKRLGEEDGLGGEDGGVEEEKSVQDWKNLIERGEATIANVPAKLKTQVVSAMQAGIPKQKLSLGILQGSRKALNKVGVDTAKRKEIESWLSKGYSIDEIFASNSQITPSQQDVIRRYIKTL